MKLSIKGKLSKINGEWVSEFTHLNISIKAPTAFKSVKGVAEFIINQLEGNNHKCSIRVDDSGVFYLSISRPRPLIKFMALCLMKNYTEVSYDQLNEWFWVEDEP